MIAVKRSINRVAAIHDLSGFGRASLAVIIPILSSMGVQVCPLPTAILSTHTGGYEDYSFVDLTDSMAAYMDHWKQLNLEFDAIYSGFLGSPKQADLVSSFIDDFSANKPLIAVDPVLGDNGKFYSTMDESMTLKMKELIGKADLITPNFTEAAFLLGKPHSSYISEREIKDWLLALSDMGPERVVITSVPNEAAHKSTSVMAYNREDGRFWKVACVYIPAYYPGVGDMFAAINVGSLLQGDSLPIAMDRGVQFITAAIRASYGLQYPQREGVQLEKVLNLLNMPVFASSYEVL